MMTAWMCPSIWFTAISGNPETKHNPFAYVIPTSSDPTSPGPCVTANRIEIRQLHASLVQGLAHNGHNRAEVFARRKFGDNAAVFTVGVELRCNDGRQHIAAVLNHCRGRLIT